MMKRGIYKKTKKISYISQETSNIKGNLDDFIKNENVNNLHVKSNSIKLGFENIQVSGVKVRIRSYLLLKVYVKM